MPETKLSFTGVMVAGAGVPTRRVKEPLQLPPGAGIWMSNGVTVVEAIPSRSKPDRGIVHSVSEVFNQHGDVVMTMRGLGMFARRPA